MAKLAKLLKTQMSGDLSALAQLLQSKGRGRDTILAHITPAEAELLKDRGGRGSTNPDTGLLEFENEVIPLEEVVVTGQAPQMGGGYGVGTDYSALTQGTQYQAPSSFNIENPISTTSPYLTSKKKQTAPTKDRFLPQSLQPSSTQMPLQAGPANVPQEALEEVTPTARTGTKGVERPQSLGSKVYEGLGGAGGLARLGLIGFLGYQGKRQGEQSAKQVQQRADELKRMALPYQTRGQEMVGAAARGELTPQGMQSLQTARAQMAQEAEGRGGVGVQQSAAQLENLRQQLLQQQMTYGLQIANIGDNIAAGAVQTAMEADQMVNSATQNFYAMLGQFAAGGNYAGQTYPTTSKTQD